MMVSHSDDGKVQKGRGTLLFCAICVHIIACLLMLELPVCKVANRAIAQNPVSVAHPNNQQQQQQQHEAETETLAKFRMPLMSGWAGHAVEAIVFLPLELVCTFGIFDDQPPAACRIMRLPTGSMG